MPTNLNFKSENLHFLLSVIFAVATEQIDLFKIWWKVHGQEPNYVNPKFKLNPKYQA